MGNCFCVTKCVKCGITYHEYKDLSYGRTASTHLHCRNHTLKQGNQTCVDCNIYPKYNVNCIHHFK